MTDEEIVPMDGEVAMTEGDERMRVDYKMWMDGDQITRDRGKTTASKHKTGIKEAGRTEGEEI